MKTITGIIDKEVEEMASKDGGELGIYSQFFVQ